MPVTPQPARIGALWFGIQVVWAAVLGVLLQSRIVELVPQDPLRTFAWLAAGGALLAAAVQVAAGFGSDRRRAVVGHRREFYVAGIALAAPALVAFCSVPSFGAFVAAFAVLQVGMNVMGGPYQAAVPDAVAPDEVGRASAWMSGAQFAGSVTGLLIAAAMPGPLTGVVLAAALLAGCDLTYRHLRALPAIAGVVTAPLRVNRDVATVLVSRGAINVGFYTLFGFLFFFVRESLGVSDARATTGLLFVTFTVAGIIGAVLAGRPADRFDKRVVVSVAAVAIALAVAALAAAPTLPVAFAAAFAAGVAWGAFFTADWAIAYAVLPRSAMAAAMGVWNLAAAIPQVVAPAITAPLVAAVDARSLGAGPRIALIAVIIEFALGTLWLWRLPPLVGATTDD